MNKFTGLEYLKIDIANAYGMDKKSWIDRICWFDFTVDNLDNIVADADEPLLFMKAVKAYHNTMAKISTGHNMFLDATASGLQIMAVLSGCKKTAAHVNLINTGKREDVYTDTAQAMNKLLTASQQVTREIIKKPHMTH